ncbi:MAG: phosphodiester glycosidase family protein [bacterium]|nr:phosphodiester glycosidase family protein [bacterium]
MQALAVKMRSKWTIIAALLLIVLLLENVQAQNRQQPRPQTEDTTAQENRIISLRSSQSPGKVRLVVETSAPPDYQVYQQNEHLIVELFGIAPCQVQPEKIRDRSFIRKWEVSHPALGLFRWDITGRYPIPTEQCRLDILENPNRLVVDIYTKWTEDENYQLTPGVAWHRRQYFGQLQPYLLWNQVTFDPQDEHLTLDIAMGQDTPNQREAVSSLVSRKNALVGINGGYFNMAGGEALGLVVRSGQIISPHVSRRPPRSVFGLTKAKKAVFARAKAINGQLLTLDNQVWPDINLALGGGPRLVANGAIQLTTDDEALGPKGNDITRPCGRTAVSADQQGRLAFTTASGYSDNHSEGIKLEQMAQLLLRSGATDAVNLDGGGSVNMSIQGNLVAHGPGAGTYERPVANALVLYDDRPVTAPAQIELKFQPAKLPADGQSTCQITAIVTDAQGEPVKDGTTVFFHAPGIQATRALTTGGKACAECKALRLSTPIPISVISGFAKAQAFIGLKYAVPDRMLVRWYRTVKESPVLQQLDTDSSLAESVQTSPTPLLDSAAASESSTAGQPMRMQIIDFRVRVIDKWYNGLSYQNIEVWNAGQMIGSYTTDQYGEVKASAQIPGDKADIEIRCADLPSVKYSI